MAAVKIYSLQLAALLPKHRSKPMYYSIPLRSPLMTSIKSLCLPATKYSSNKLINFMYPNTEENICRALTTSDLYLLPLSVKHCLQTLSSFLIFSPYNFTFSYNNSIIIINIHFTWKRKSNLSAIAYANILYNIQNYWLSHFSKNSFVFLEDQLLLLTLNLMHRPLYLLWTKEDSRRLSALANTLNLKSRFTCLWNQLYTAFSQREKERVTKR